MGREAPGMDLHHLAPRAARGASSAHQFVARHPGSAPAQRSRIPNQRPAWFVIDELASLQRLPQLHTAITENRKSQQPSHPRLPGPQPAGSPLRRGCRGDALAAGHQDLPQDQRAARRQMGQRSHRRSRDRTASRNALRRHARRQNFALDRQTEPLVLPSEISGLDELHAFLKYGNHVARFSFPFIDLPKMHPGFIERKMDDFLPSPPPAPTARRPRSTSSYRASIPGNRRSLEFENGQI